MAGEWAIVPAAGVGGLAAGVPALVSIPQTKIQAEERSKGERVTAQSALLARIAQQAASYEYGGHQGALRELRAALYELSVTATSGEIRQIARD